MKNTLTRKHTICWADDDCDDLDIFCEALEDHAPGHKVLEFGNGYALFEYLKSIQQHEYPCVIVLDLNMPVMDGKKTLECIKKDTSFRHIPVVVLTTSSSPKDRLYCEQLQAEMITKPTSYEKLTTIIQNLVALCNSANN